MLMKINLKNSRTAAAGVLVSAVAVFSILCFIFFPESIDDAYITLRFSENLASGNGPVLNPGERVEGYSNFLWMALLAAIGKTGIPPEYAMKSLGFASGLFAMALVFFAARRELKDDLTAAAAVLLLASSPYVALWAADGLETVFYASLLTALFSLCVSPAERPILKGAVAVAVALTRPEGVMFSLISFSYELMNGHAYKGETATGPYGQRSWKAFAAGVTVFSVIFISYFAFRYYYFGALVPNTALAKVHFGAGSIGRGLLYLNMFNVQSGYILLPLAIFGTMGVAGSSYTTLLAAFVSAQIFFLTVSGGDFMYGYRFLVPVYPFFCLLSAGAAARAARRLGPGTGLLLSIAAAAIISGCQYTSLPQKRIATDNLTYRAGAHFEVARFLQKAASGGETIMLSEAGIIPYYLKRNTIIDYLGLVSDYGRVNPQGRIDLNYLFSRKPDYILLTALEDAGEVCTPRLYQDKKISEYEGFKTGYELIQKFRIEKDRSFLESLYYRNDPEAAAIFFLLYKKSKSTREK